VPFTLLSVKCSEFPNELSTCVCDAKCMIVSTSFASMRCRTRSAEQMSPCTKWNCGFDANGERLLSDEHTSSLSRQINLYEGYVRAR
jgi:hypothetical protein